MMLDRIEEPFIKAQIITKSDYVGCHHDLVYREARRCLTNQTYLTSDRVELSFDMPSG